MFQWRHVSGNVNPADDCTRGCQVDDQNHHNRWFNSPAFLNQSAEFWPSQDPFVEFWPSQDPFVSPLTEDDPEVKSSKWMGSIFASELYIYFPNPEKFSSWTRLRRVVAWICRFVRHCKLEAENRMLSPLTASEICHAEIIIIRRSQRESFYIDIESLKEKKRLPVKSRLSALCPFVDENELLRVGGRLRKAPVPEETKHPLILDPKHLTTRLMIMYHHYRLYCSSDKQLLNELRQRFWILKGLASVKKTTFSCMTCRRQRGKTEPPVMADLPKSRVGYQQPPFTNTGADYFGPMLVRNGRKTEKRYGALFTSLTTQAVHIEIAHSLDADSFLMAMRRMMARCGRPAHIFSDNGTNFVSAESELRDAVRRLREEGGRICDELPADGIQWHFNPPLSPHFGGAWERLVQSAKRAHKAVAGKQCVNDETLLTFMSEVESLMNGRPLTHVSCDQRDEEALTPNHFLLRQANPNLPPDVVNDKDSCGLRDGSTHK